LDFSHSILDALICAQSSGVSAMLPIASCLVSGVRRIARSQLLGESLVSSIAQFPHQTLPQFSSGRLPAFINL
jgi:hypothetical protein